MTLSTAPAEAPIVIQQSHPSLALTEVESADVNHGFLNGGTLKLAYQDCGASHGKVTGLSPNTLTLGQKTTVTGSGNVDEAVTDGTFEMNIKASILSKSCTGNICQPSTCPLPAGVGSITWNGMKCPLAKGDVTVGTDVMLSGALPPWAARATIGIKGKASNGDDLLCMTLSTAPAEAPTVIQQSHPSLALPEAESADVNANSIIDGNNNLNGHDNGVNVNVNVLGIQMKKNVESANVTIDGKNNSNGHDNGVNVDVNVYGVQLKEDGGQLKEDSSTWSMSNALSSLFGCTNGGTLKLAYQDCGAAHGKVTGLSPSTLTLGQKTTVTGSGSVDEAVTDGTFEMNIKASILSKTCTGNICQPSTCPLPAGVGS